MGLAAIVLAVALLRVPSGSDDVIPRGVTVAGADLGGLTRQQAIQVLETHLARLEAAPVTLTFEGRTWQPTLAELGGNIDLERTLDQATAGQSLLARLRARLLGFAPEPAPLYVTLDQQQLDRYLSRLSGEIDRPPAIPRLELRDGQLLLHEPQPGVRVDQNRLREAVLHALQSLQPSAVEIPVQTVPAAYGHEDVQAAVAKLSRFLSHPLTLTFEGRSWEIDPATVASLLLLVERPEASAGQRLAVRFAEEQTASYLGTLLSDLWRPARNAEVAWDGRRVVAVSESQDGLELDLPAMLAALNDAIEQGASEVPVRVKRIEPAISSGNLEELGIRELIGVGETVYAGSSPERAHNIRVAAGYLNGTLIPPGATFSFNEAIGPITEERGYREGYVILAEETVPGIGGGVCQVATTTFRAAFFAGLPFVERHPHRYRVLWYELDGWPVGFDAAIFQPGADLKFQNTTGAYILVQTEVTEEKLYVYLYGTSLGYEVELQGPEIANEVPPPPDVEEVDPSLAPGERRQVEWAKAGMDVTITRVLKRGGQVVQTERFFTRYQPWGNKYLVGPAPAEEPTPAVEEPAPTPEGHTPADPVAGEQPAVEETPVPEEPAGSPTPEG
ncbi:Vancomycin B-type resistance protein VanW [bacterium HR26]|nr:Vancomycin B-type resistance protein VanW [bacterium HR26]